MTIWDSLNRIIVSQESAYIAGLIAAFTPCTLALIPLFLYRFGLWDGSTRISWKHTLRELTLVLVGFLGSFVVFGLLFQYLLGSNFVNITRLALGMLLVFVGVLQLGGQVTFSSIRKVSNPLVLGIFLPVVVSFSPCVLPFLSTLLLNASSSTTGIAMPVLIRFLLFGLGILTPAIFLDFAGKAGLSLLKRTQPALHVINLIAPWLVISAGVYIASQLVRVTSADIVWSTVAAAVFFLFVSGSILRKPSLRTQFNFSMLVIAGALITIASVYAYTTALPYDSAIYGADLLTACLPSSHTNSPIATTEMLIFAGIGLLLGVWKLRSTTASKRVRFSV